MRNGAELQAIIGHLHQFDAVSVRIFDPGLVVAIDGLLFRLGEADALVGKLGNRSVDIIDLKAKMIRTYLVRHRHPPAVSAGEQLKILRVGNAQVDDPKLTVAVKPEHLGEAEFANIEVKRTVDVADPKRDMGDGGDALHRDPPGNGTK